LHADEKGFVFIPPMAFKVCLAEAAKFLGRQIPGKESHLHEAFRERHSRQGSLAAPGQEGRRSGRVLFVPADGMRGSGKRVDNASP
jgi:hypothetical protein